MNATVKVHAAALLVALIEAGELDAAESFVEWCIENLELELGHILEETDA